MRGVRDKRVGGIAITTVASELRGRENQKNHCESAILSAHPKICEQFHIDWQSYFALTILRRAVCPIVRLGLSVCDPASLFRTPDSRARSSVATEALERCQDRIQLKPKLVPAIDYLEWESASHLRHRSSFSRARTNTGK